ncbi:hypothetical protein BRADI_2g48355v3 [Brachypodium distachyon]|uniref:Btz domain-containing protein n=1 Tax=Brachypodium distachyon TaxID=15368 RepID=A0A0Q3KEQ8_BRADI|nr:hypothetical protein BRADI_2g48355v3 [Brachypodium distachyon]
MAEKEKAAAEAEEEYASDVDDAPLPAEEDGGGGGAGSPLPSRVVGSDFDSDRQGGAEVYDEDEGSEEREVVHKEFDAAGCGGGEAKEVAEFFSGQKLWYPKDDRVWMHDRFDEISIHNVQHDNNYRNVPRRFQSYYDDKNFSNARRESRIHHCNSKDYNGAPNVYRGKPSRPYQSHWNNTSDVSSVHNGTYYRSQNEDARRHEQEFPRRQELPFIQRRKVRPDIFSKLFSSSVRMAHSSMKPQSRPISRVKGLFPFSRHRNVVDSLTTVYKEGMHRHGLHSSLSTSNHSDQYSKSRDQGRGLKINEPTKNKPSSTSQATRSYTESNHAICQQRSIQQPLLSTPRASTQIFHQTISSTDKIESDPQTTETIPTEDEETSPPPGSNNYVAPCVVIGKNDKEERVNASFFHGGGLVLGVSGAIGLALGDQGFACTPAVLPVVQFSGQRQHLRGPHNPFPSHGMALPGTLIHHPGGNSEISQMIWLPILTAATGALGATFSPHLDSYDPQPSELPSSSVSPRLDHSQCRTDSKKNLAGFGISSISL